MSTATRITIADFDRMIAEGYFESQEKRQRIELIDGELCPMSPIGPIHGWIVDRLARWSCNNTSDDVVHVRIQGSIGLPELESVPEPDIAWAKATDYRTARPVSGDILLVIEVADSGLTYDRGQKAKMYASVGIADYWVINIPDGCVEVFRQPEEGRYRSRQIFKASDDIHPLAFPEIALPVAKIFPSET